MTVYVDNHYLYATSRFRGMRMSHMIADTDEELHAMAARIGLRREWYQGDHYDVGIGKRAQAVACGAREVTWRQLGQMVVKRRRNERKTA